MYRTIAESPARSAIDWSRVEMWWSDERFLPPGPWLVIAAAQAPAPPVRTPDDDPARVYQDASIAIDAVNPLPSCAV